MWCVQQCCARKTMAQLAMTTGEKNAQGVSPSVHPVRCGFLLNFLNPRLKTLLVGNAASQVFWYLSHAKFAILLASISFSRVPITRECMGRRVQGNNIHSWAEWRHVGQHYRVRVKTPQVRNWPNSSKVIYPPVPDWFQICLGLGVVKLVPGLGWLGSRQTHQGNGELKPSLLLQVLLHWILTLLPRIIILSRSLIIFWTLWKYLPSNSNFCKPRLK